MYCEFSFPARFEDLSASDGDAGDLNTPASFHVETVFEYHTLGELSETLNSLEDSLSAAATKITDHECFDILYSLLLSPTFTSLPSSAKQHLGQYLAWCYDYA